MELPITFNLLSTMPATKNLSSTSSKPSDSSALRDFTKDAKRDMNLFPVLKESNDKNKYIPSHNRKVMKYTWT